MLGVVLRTLSLPHLTSTRSVNTVSSLPTPLLLPLSKPLSSLTWLIQQPPNRSSSFLEWSIKKKKFSYLAVPGLSCGMQDLRSLLWHGSSSSLTRDWTQSLSHWTTKEIPRMILLKCQSALLKNMPMFSPLTESKIFTVVWNLLPDTFLCSSPTLPLISSPPISMASLSISRKAAAHFCLRDFTLAESCTWDSLPPGLTCLILTAPHVFVQMFPAQWSWLWVVLYNTITITQHQTPNTLYPVLFFPHSMFYLLYN